MTREQILALGYPEGEVLEKAEALAKHMEEKGYPQKGVSVEPMDEEVIADFLLHVKKRPALHSHISYHETVHELSFAWSRHNSTVPA